MYYLTEIHNTQLVDFFFMNLVSTSFLHVEVSKFDLGVKPA